MTTDSQQLDRVHELLGGLTADSQNEIFPPAWRAGLGYAAEQLEKVLYDIPNN